MKFFLLLFFSYNIFIVSVGFSQFGDTSKYSVIPQYRLNSKSRLKNFEFEKGKTDLFWKVKDFHSSRNESWKRMKISEVRTLGRTLVDEGTITAINSNGKLLVLKSGWIDLPLLPNGSYDELSEYSITLRQECNFRVDESIASTPARVTLKFENSGYSYDYYLTELGTKMDSLVIPFLFSRDSYLWHGTRFSLELSFISNSTNYWMIKGIELHKNDYLLYLPVLNFDPTRPRPMGGRVSSGGSGTSGPSGPR